MAKFKEADVKDLPCPGGIYHALPVWCDEMQKHLPALSQSQAWVLALWSLGMILAQSCGLSTVVLYVATVLKKKENTVRQQLREFYQEAAAKRGEQRTEVEVADCFAGLLAWVLARWEGNQLVLALDATQVKQRFVVLVVSVVYRGCAIPVAWQVLPMTKKAAWRPHWLRLVRQLRPAVPRKMKVLVWGDRGLYGRWLFRRIRRLKWHPLLRVNTGGTFCPTGTNRFLPFTSFVPEKGRRWSGSGVAFKTKACRLPCTLLAWWEEGYEDPWLLLTDLEAANAEVIWYGLRAWIERGFKLLKRAGWQWQGTRMTDAERATRLWLTLAVATLWLVSVGGEAEAEVELATVPPLVTVKRRRSGTKWRATGIFQRGAALLLVALLKQEELPLGRFYPEPWPVLTPVAVEQQVIKKGAGGLS